MFKEASVLVTGATGFLGDYIMKELLAREAYAWGVGKTRPTTFQGDLTRYREVERIFSAFSKPFDFVFHIAGYNGGIQFNLDKPADIFSANTKMAMNILEAAHKFGAKKVVSIITSCGYPDIDYINSNMLEQCYLGEAPNNTVACHGYAKRNLLLASKFYNMQYGLNAVCVCPTTMYGPKDNFDINRTKVVGGMIKRFILAQQNNAPSVECWGTGAARREFLYVEDAAKMIVDAGKLYNESMLPLNIGSGQETTIKELAEKVKSAVKYEGEILWDSSKPDGQLRKRLNTERQQRVLGNVSLTPLEVGLQKTVDWCKDKRIV